MNGMKYQEQWSKLAGKNVFAIPSFIHLDNATKKDMNQHNKENDTCIHCYTLLFTNRKYNWQHALDNTQ